MRRCAVIVFLVLSCLLVAAQTKRLISDKDIFRFQWIGDPQASPDGAHVVFVRVTVNEKKDNYDTALWMVSTAGSNAPVRLTTGKRDSQPRWSPDGKWIVFVRGSAEPPKDGKPPAAQLALLSLSCDLGQIAQGRLSQLEQLLPLQITFAAFTGDRRHHGRARTKTQKRWWLRPPTAPNTPLSGQARPLGRRSCLSGSLCLAG